MQVDGSVVDDPDWANVSDVARRRGVTRQAIHKRVKLFAGRGMLATRGEGRALRFHLPTFESLTADSHDPAQDLRNRHQIAAQNEESDSREGAKAPQAAPTRAAERPAFKEPSKPSAYDSASAREKNAKAELAEMLLAQKRGELVEARTLADAAVVVGTEIGQSVSSLKTKAGKLYAAGTTGGEEALHIELVGAVNAILTQVAESLAKLATPAAQKAD